MIHDKRGVVSMANKGPDTNGSQFFITYGLQPHLNSKYTIIAQVIDGFETLDSMEKVPVGTKNRPLADIILESVTIHANPWINLSIGKCMRTDVFKNRISVVQYALDGIS